MGRPLLSPCTGRWPASCIVPCITYAHQLVSVWSLSFLLKLANILSPCFPPHCGGLRPPPHSAPLGGGVSVVAGFLLT